MSVATSELTPSTSRSRAAYGTSSCRWVTNSMAPSRISPATAHWPPPMNTRGGDHDRPPSAERITHCSVVGWTCIITSGVQQRWRRNTTRNSPSGKQTTAGPGPQ